MTLFLQTLGQRGRLLALPALTHPVHEQLRFRAVGIDKHGHLVSLFPVPMWQQVQGKFLLVPEAAVEIEPVLRNGSQVYDSEH